MFKKPFRIASNTPLKGSDRKRLIARILQQFPRLQEEQLASVMTAKDEIYVAKTITEERAVLYLAHDDPLFIEVGGRFAPTVYTLWRIPDLLLTLPVHTAVFSRLAGGADLMLPGLALGRDEAETWQGLDALGPFQPGDLCAIRTVDNMAPIAVGELVVSAAQAREQGLRGRGVRVWHVHTDELWRLGTKSQPPQIDPPPQPPAAAAPAAPDATAAAASAAVASAPDDDTGSGAGTGPVVAAAGAAESCAAPAAAAPERVAGPAEAAAVTDVGVAPSAPDDGEQAAETGAAAAVDATSAADAAGGTADPDEQLVHACALALHAVPAAALPLLYSTFHSQHVLPLRERGVPVPDVKQTAFKKVGRLMSALAERGLLVVKETKGVGHIIQISRRHPMLQATAAAGAGAAGAAAGGGRGGGAADGPQVEEVYVAPADSAAAALMHPLGRPYATEAELGRLVWAYARAQQLAEGKVIRLDSTLASACRGELDARLPHGDIVRRLLAHLGPMHRVRGEPGLRKGKVRPIEITAINRAGHKVVTVVAHLALVGLEPRAVAEKAQHKFAASCTTQPSQQARMGDEVLIQGAFLHETAEWLQTEFQIPAGVIVLHDKRKSK